MSNLLNEAIVDAKALKEAALKNAEAAVIDKYSEEVKQTLDALLEQEEEALAPAEDLPAEEAPAEMDPMADLGGAAADPMADTMGAAPEEAFDDIAPDVPLAAADDFLEGGDSEGENVSFNVDLQALQEAIADLSDELSEDEEIDITEEAIANLLEDDEDDEEADDLEEATSAAPGMAGDEAIEADDDDDDSAAALAGSAAAEEADSDAMKNAGLEEDYESMADAIMEKLTVDMGFDLSGWAGRSEEDKKYNIEKELAHRRSTEVEEEMKTLKQAQEDLVFENSQLSDKLTNYERAVGELKQSLHEVNLSNARLLYTNRILRNTSLNERQKSKVVEAISNAGSVTEARTIYDTLESTVQSTPKRGPQSLGEAINRRSSVIRASRHESTSSDPVSDRMKKLAGIN